MGIGLLFSFSKRDSMTFRLFAIAVIAQSIKAGHPDSVDRLLAAGEVWFTNPFYCLFMFD
jgi:hypothetical protein